jgi:hypothetical protein
MMMMIFCRRTSLFLFGIRLGADPHFATLWIPSGAIAFSKEMVATRNCVHPKANPFESLELEELSI